MYRSPIHSVPHAQRFCLNIIRVAGPFTDYYRLLHECCNNKPHINYTQPTFFLPLSARYPSNSSLCWLFVCWFVARIVLPECTAVCYVSPSCSRARHSAECDAWSVAAEARATQQSGRQQKKHTHAHSATQTHAHAALRSTHTRMHKVEKFCSGEAI